MQMYSSQQALNDAMLLCRDCGVLHPLPPELPAPDQEDIVDLESFRSTHREHTLERAARLPDPVLHDRPAWDPMARSWFRVSVGEAAFFVCSSRDSIDEPRSHQICHEPPTMVTRAEFDEAVLRRSIEQHFFPATISSDKLGAFVRASRDIAASVDTECLEMSYADTEIPNAEIGACPLEVVRDLKSLCENVFANDWERERMTDFIDGNVDEYGALAIRLLQEIQPSA